MKKKNYVYKTVSIAMLTAVATVLYLFEIPLISFGFLKYDLSDIAALIGGIFLGPASGALIEFLKNVIHVLTKGLGSTMGFGDLMNFIVGTAYIVPFVILYKFFSSKMNKALSILVSAIISSAIMVAIGAGANYFIAPLYFKYFVGQEITKEFLMTYLVSATSLNAVKSAILSVVSYPIILLLLDKLKKVSRISE